MHSNSESSEDEGFYKPSIQITQPTPAPNTEFASISLQQQFDNAIDIVTEDRPVDFLPRLLNTGTQYYATPIPEETICDIPGQFMDPIPYNKANSKDSRQCKDKRYSSLQAKYKNNPDFELVYSKVPENSQFSSYIFCLENTPDYNPNDFMPISGDPLPSESIFDSRFESGNLLYAFARKNADSGAPEFDLILQNDTNTKGFSQWFYFAVRNNKTKKMKLNIVNFIKKGLMFLDGVRPVMFSQKLYAKQKVGWRYAGENCCYGKSYITREIAGTPPQFKNYYCFSFQISFPEQNDETFLALNFPYTYSRMMRHIDLLVTQTPEEIATTKSILCHSISNNPIPCLTIEHRSPSRKKTILCLGRQHPGETVGSFVLEAFLNRLLAKTKLLEQYRFVVVPMLNPDGVIYGNFRTNLAGFDLNRQWTEPNRWLHPEVFFLTKFIASLGDIEFCMDFHGHSKKMNTFIYACTGDKINDFRLYPYIYSQKCDLFSLKDCTYNISLDKLKTARVNVFNEVKKPFIFTLQTSFYGHTKEGKYQRFTFKDFQAIGQGAIDSLEVLMLDKKTLSKFETEVKDKNYMFQQWAMQNKEDDGSESNPSEDELNPIERKAKVMSDLKARKPAKKMVKKNLRMRKKSPKKKKEILQYLLKQKADSAILLQKKKSDKKLPMQAKQNQSAGVIIIEDTKKIRGEARRQISQSYMEPKMKPPPPIMPRPQQIKVMGPRTVKAEQRPKLNSTINSNLFDTGNYLKMREQISMELKKVQDPRLEISCMASKEEISTSENSSRLQYLKAQKMRKEFEELAPVYSQPKKKSMEKVYVIKQNKVVSSITRVNEQEMRKNIEREISNRTMALKNCQKIMSTFSIEKASRNSADSREFFKEEDPYRTKKLLQPLDIKRHRNFNGFKEEERAGVFFSFLGN